MREHACRVRMMVVERRRAPGRATPTCLQIICYAALAFVGCNKSKAGRWLASIDCVGGFFCEPVIAHCSPVFWPRRLRLSNLHPRTLRWKQTQLFTICLLRSSASPMYIHQSISLALPYSDVISWFRHFPLS